MIRFLLSLAFAAGLLVVGWTGAGYAAGSPVPLALVLLIGAFYLLGAWELYRFQQATAGLARLVAATGEAPPSLAGWLGALPPGLRHAVRLRVEGDRLALPPPALAPFLTGLLVLLGMLGTFLGMVATLKGTGLALEGATDLDAIRASLAAPVKGLGVAFGTSVAGVGASAALGLMSALARRERLRAAQALDARIATTLRGFSRAHQRDESLRLLKTQVETAPAVAAQLERLVAQIDRQAQALQDRLVADQARFHDEAQRAYTGLAASVDRTLRQSLADGARLAAAAIEPAVRATMDGLAQESARLHAALADAADRQLAGVGARLDTAVASLAGHWQAAVSDQLRHHDALTQGLHAGLDRAAQTFEQRSAALLEGLADRADRSAAAWADLGREALARQREGHAALAEHTRDALAATLAGFDVRAAAMLRDLGAAQAARDADAARHERERMTAFHDGLAAWRETLERSAEALGERADAQAKATVAEVARLVQAAAEAPRAAAEVLGELRVALGDSLARDNAALDERVRLMGTLDGLLGAVHRASTGQQAAIDTLVRSTTGALERAAERFAETVAAEARTLHDVSAQAASSAAEVASLGEGFGAAVRLFAGAGEQMTAQLQRIEAALGHSMARSDEQLAYYVAQAREIVDLTLGAQKQIVEDLQRLAAPPAAGPRAPAATLETDAA